VSNPNLVLLFAIIVLVLAVLLVAFNV